MCFSSQRLIPTFNREVIFSGTSLSPHWNVWASTVLWPPLASLPPPLPVLGVLRAPGCSQSLFHDPQCVTFPITKHHHFFFLSALPKSLCLETICLNMNTPWSTYLLKSQFLPWLPDPHQPSCGFSVSFPEGYGLTTLSGFSIPAVKVRNSLYLSSNILLHPLEASPKHLRHYYHRVTWIGF